MTRTRWWLAASVLLLLALGAFVWFRYDLLPRHAHNVWRDRVVETLRSLKEKRPAGVSEECWECVVRQTSNMHVNCGQIGWGLKDHRPTDPIWMEQFATELERRMAGPLTLADIDWIWDEYAAHTHYGQWYSDSYRPTRGDVCPP